MVHRKIVHILLLLLAFSLSPKAFAQIDTEFWFAIPNLTDAHDNSNGAGQGRIYFTTFQSEAHITISQPAALPSDAMYLPPMQIVVPPDSSVCVYVGGTGGLNRVAKNGNSYCGVHIESDVHITSYFAQTNNNSEIYTLKGKNALGTEFVVPFQRDHGNAHGGVSSIEILATEANTTVQVTQPGAAPITITLTRAGETYTIPQTGSTNMGGTVITSDKPITVNSTDDSVASYGQDLIGEQLVPTSLAGSEYIAVKHNTTGDEKLYLYPLRGQGLSYSVNGGATATIAAGGFATVPLTAAVTYISGNVPFVCFQMTGDGGELGGTVLPRLDCTGSREVALHRQFPNQRVMLLVKNQYTGYFKVNGTPQTFSFNPISGTGWSYTIATTGLFNNRGVARILNDSAVFHCAVLDYGGGTCSYGYFSAYGTVTLSPMSSKPIYVEGETLSLYVPDSMLFRDLQWITPDGTVYAGASLSVPATVGGYYAVTGLSREGCELTEDTVRLLVHVVRPVSKDTTVCISAEYPESTTAFYDSLHVGSNMLMQSGPMPSFPCPSAATTRFLESVSVQSGTDYHFEMDVQSVGVVNMAYNVYLADQLVQQFTSVRAPSAPKTLSFDWQAVRSGKTELRIEVSGNSTSAQVMLQRLSFAPMVMVHDTLHIIAIDCSDPEPHPCPEVQHDTTHIEQYCDTLLPYTWRKQTVTSSGIYRDTIRTKGTYDDGPCDSIIYVLEFSTIHCEREPDPDPDPDPDPEPCVDGLIAQRWNDVLTLLNAEHNGGYEIVSWRWYCNGNALDNTDSYIYFPDGLTPGDEYVVDVTTSDGETLHSCPFVIGMPHAAQPLPAAGKIVENNRIYILRDNRRYTPQGQLVK